MYKKLEISNHMCKRYIERILNITKPPEVLRYLKSHQYEIYLQIFELFEKSQFIYSGNLNNSNYKIKDFYLKDNILLVFSDNIGVTLYKAISDKDLYVNNIIMQISSLKDKIEKLESNKKNIMEDIVKNKIIKIYLEGELLQTAGDIENYLFNKIDNQNKIIKNLTDELNNVYLKIISTNDLHVSAVNKLVKGKWVRISDEILIKDIIND